MQRKGGGPGEHDGGGFELAKKEALTKEEILFKAITDIKQKFGEGAIMRLGEKTNMDNYQIGRASCRERV